MKQAAIAAPALAGTHPSFLRPRLHWLKGLVLPVLILLLWDGLARRNVGQGFAFVTIGALGSALGDVVRSGDLANNVLASLQRVGIGVVLGGTLGIATGAAMALSRTFDRLFGPLYHAIRQVPTLGWIPLLGLWFGYGELPKILIVTKAAMFPMTLNAYEGLKGVREAYLDVGRVLTLNGWRLFWWIRFRAALPMILTGLQQGLAFAWVACIGTEILFGSGAGIGAMIETGQVQGRMDVVLLGVIFVGVIAWAITTLFSRIAAPQLRWRGGRDKP